jgi:ABC-type Fe3+-hydroxamate transport system substrate-binding protein
METIVPTITDILHTLTFAFAAAHARPPSSSPAAAEPTCLADVIASVRTVGKEGGAVEEAEVVAQRLEAGFETIRAAVKGLPRPKVAFLEWTGVHWHHD